jgi:hypothetical protein
MFDENCSDNFPKLKTLRDGNQEFSTRGYERSLYFVRPAYFFGNMPIVLCPQLCSKRNFFISFFLSYFPFSSVILKPHIRCMCFYHIRIHLLFICTLFYDALSVTKTVAYSVG